MSDLDDLIELLNEPRPIGCRDLARYELNHRAGKRLQAFKDAIDWVLNDAAYKSPEQVGDTAARWIMRLRAAKED